MSSSPPTPSLPLPTVTTAPLAIYTAPLPSPSAPLVASSGAATTQMTAPSTAPSAAVYSERRRPLLLPPPRCCSSSPELITALPLAARITAPACRSLRSRPHSPSSALANALFRPSRRQGTSRAAAPRRHGGLAPLSCLRSPPAFPYYSGRAPSRPLPQLPLGHSRAPPPAATRTASGGRPRTTAASPRSGHGHAVATDLRRSGALPGPPAPWACTQTGHTRCARTRTHAHPNR